MQRNVFLHLLRMGFPGARVSWVVGEYVTRVWFQQELVRRHSYADEILICPDAEDRDPVAWAGFLDRLADHHVDACVVDPAGLGLGPPDARDAGIGIRMAVPTGGPDDGLITHPLRLPPPTTKDGNDLYDYATALADALDITTPPADQVVPRLPLRTEQVPTWATRSNRTQPLVGIHPGGMKGWNRRWPLANYATLSTQLVEEYQATLLICGSDDEHHETTLLRDTVTHHCPNAQVHLSIGEPLNRVANLIDHMDLLIGNDSGLAHLAAALTTPTLVLNGPIDGAALCARVYPAQRAVDKHYPCQIRPNTDYEWDGQCARGCPCTYVSPDGPYPRCLTDITVDDVWPAVVAQLGRPPGEGPTRPVARRASPERSR